MTSDNHNYQRTFPLKYNNGDSSYPIVANKDQNNYDTYNGVIYLVTGTAGRSHYKFEGQATYIVKQDDKNFGFLNIDVNGKTLKGTIYWMTLQFQRKIPQIIIRMLYPTLDNG